MPSVGALRMRNAAGRGQLDFATAAIENPYPTPQAAAGPPDRPERVLAFPLPLDSGAAREMKMPMRAGFMPARYGVGSRRAAVRDAGPSAMTRSMRISKG